MYKLFTLVLLLLCTTLSAQERIDGSMEFQTDPNKKYSIFVPSSYDATVPNEMMVGLHPLNTNRWDAEAWCDTLIQFCEMNNLLMICPDGGADGKIDDAIDTAFTTVIIDSMLQWYNVDETKIWAMGFSWGGKTTYSYGLNHIDRFAGFMPIGAAINGTGEIQSVLPNAKGKPYFLVHGDQDSPNIRFTPLLNALTAAEACVSSNLLANVAHTIDFPNRNDILTEAMTWLRDQNCIISSTDDTKKLSAVTVGPNPSSGSIQINNLNGNEEIEIVNIRGAVLLKTAVQSSTTSLEIMKHGVFLVHIINGAHRTTHKIVIQ